MQISKSHHKTRALLPYSAIPPGGYGGPMPSAGDRGSDLEIGGRGSAWLAGLAH